MTAEAEMGVGEALFSQLNKTTNKQNTLTKTNKKNLMT